MQMHLLTLYLIHEYNTIVQCTYLSVANKFVKAASFNNSIDSTYWVKITANSVKEETSLIWYRPKNRCKLKGNCNSE